MEIKLCVNCKWHSLEQDGTFFTLNGNVGPLEHYCKNEFIDVVTGKSVPIMRKCHFERSGIVADNLQTTCGPYGTYFEPLQN